MNKKIWIDLTDISGWTGNFTGIQRVVFNLSYRFYENKEAVFFRYDERTRSFYNIDFGEIIERFNKKNIEIIKNKDLKQTVYELYANLPNSVKLAMPKSFITNAKRTYKLSSSMVERIPRHNNYKASQELLKTKVVFSDTDTVVVFGNNWDRSIFIEDLGKQKQEFGFKVYHLVYDLIPTLGPQFFGLELFSVYAKYIFETIALSDGIFCISESTQKDLAHFCQSVGLPMPESCVIRLGDTLEKTKSSSIISFKNKDYILCVGTIEVRKNHTLLYYAWKEALLRKEKIPQLVIVGRKGWNTENIRYTLLNDPDIKEHIVILEDVNDSELKWLYENCLFSIYPSLYEGWGLPIAESLGYGKLCLASNTSSMPEIAGDLIDYFSPYNSGECLAIIQEYSNNPDKLKNKENLISKSYQKTQWNTTYEKVRSFIDLS